MNPKAPYIVIACLFCFWLKPQAQNIVNKDSSNSTDSDLNRSKVAEKKSNSQKEHTFKLKGIQLLGLAPRAHSSDITLAQMRSAAPESQLLQRDYSDFEKDQILIGNNTTLRPTVSLLLNFDINSQNSLLKKLRPELRAGLTYSSTQLLAGSLKKEETEAVGNKQGERLDSVYFQIINFTNVPHLIMGHVSLLIKSNPERRFSFYGGLGFEAGTSFKSTNKIAHLTNSRIETVDSDNNRERERMGRGEGRYEEESVKTGASQMYSVFLPLGVNVRFSKKHSFFSKLNFFMEFRWIYDTVRIKGIDRAFGGIDFSRQDIYNGLGFRYNLQSEFD